MRTGRRYAAESQLARDSRSAIRIAGLAAAIALGLGGWGGSGRAPNSPSVLGALTFSTNENVPLSGQLSASDPDGDTLTFSKTAGPAHGAVTSFTPAGAFVYHPAANFTGADAFTIQAQDSAGNVIPGMVSITVRVDQPPAAGNLVQRADGAALASLDVLAKAQDPDGDPLTVSIEQPPLVGNATVNADGSIALPGLSAGFKGLTRFEYRVMDPSGAYAVGTAAIFIGADPFRVAFAGDVLASGAPNGGDRALYTAALADPGASA